MGSDQLHSWDVGKDEARDIQQRLRNRVITKDSLGPVNYVAGIDVGFEQQNSITRAAVVVLSFPALELQDHALARRPVSFPYIPGLLSFREVPAVLDAYDKLSILPDLVLCDGQGIAHPRRFGIACHLGVWLNVPAVGVAKSRLTGTHGEVPNRRGGYTGLYDRGECIGAVLRTRVNVRPLYISIGHRICLQTAIDYVMRCTTRFRLPETTRFAHRLASG
jgi:deoxyribonuclease V